MNYGLAYRSTALCTHTVFKRIITMEKRTENIFREIWIEPKWNDLKDVNITNIKQVSRWGKFKRSSHTKRSNKNNEIENFQ